MSLKGPELLLWQFSDNLTYTNTMMLLNTYDAQEVGFKVSVVRVSHCGARRFSYQIRPFHQVCMN